MASGAKPLNIKDPEVYRLAEALANAKGETLTEAVRVALRERWEREIAPERRRGLERVRKMLAEVDAERAKRGDLPQKFTEEDMYDERGLPK